MLRNARFFPVDVRGAALRCSEAGWPGLHPDTDIQCVRGSPSVLPALKPACAVHQTPGVHCGHLDRWFEKEFEGGMQSARSPSCASRSLTQSLPVHFTSQDTLEAALKSRGCNLIQAEICDMAGGGVTSKCLLYNKTVLGPLVAPEGAL